MDCWCGHSVYEHDKEGECHASDLIGLTGAKHPCECDWFDIVTEPDDGGYE